MTNLEEFLGAFFAAVLKAECLGSVEYGEREYRFIVCGLKGRGRIDLCVSRSEIELYKSPRAIAELKANDCMKILDGGKI